MTDTPAPTPASAKTQAYQRAQTGVASFIILGVFALMIGIGLWASNVPGTEFGNPEDVDEGEAVVGLLIAGAGGTLINVGLIAVAVMYGIRLANRPQ
jgi:hypothetical protein